MLCAFFVCSQSLLIIAQPFGKNGFYCRAEEFEFHWWDHVFNSAAKGISVNESKVQDHRSYKIDFQCRMLTRSSLYSACSNIIKLISV